MQDGVNGLLFPGGDSQALATQLKRLIDDPKLLETLRAGIAPVRTIAEDAAALIALYREHLPPFSPQDSPSMTIRTLIGA